MELTRGFQDWVQQYVDEGWVPYQISFMFAPLPGNQRAILRQMQPELDRVYGKLVTRFDHNPTSPTGTHRRPVMMLFPDLPVYKHAKKSLGEIAINDGLHYGGPCLTPPISRFRSTLDAYFVENQQHYISDKLQRIHVTPITYDPRYVTEYLAKTIKRGRIAYDNIVIFPKAPSELSKDKSRRAQRRPARPR